MAGEGKVHQDTEHGIAASHPERAVQPFLVAPTTGDDFNTFALDIDAVACVQLRDILFEFDSSFPTPNVAQMLKELPGLRDKNKNDKGQFPPMSIFGHADPSGEDAYNKQLSGRRAMAIFSVLTRDLTLWNFLFDNPFGGDDWKAKNVLASMRSALGAPSSQPRQDLSKAYMQLLSPTQFQKSDFLGQGKDAKGKADFQGCSEFNPLMLLSTKENQSLSKAKRNEENAGNRRVVIFLFRAGMKVNAATWPCPTALAGTAECVKRFFGPPKTGEIRRKPGPERREFAKTEDTFGCRFYDRIARLSPCEKPVPPPILLGVNPLIFFESSEPVVTATGETAPKRAVSSLVPSVGASQISLAKDIVLVKKPYTRPVRVPVILKTDTTFDGNGVLTVNDKERIFFFPSATATNQIQFNGIDNLFKGAQLDPKGPGVTIFAEGRKASTAMKDVVLTLRLSGGTKKPGPDAVAQMTAIELTLDICAPRVNATTEPVPLPQAPEVTPATPADKFFLGRPIPIQDAAKIQERAKLIIQPVKTASFAALNKKLVLVRIGTNVTTFAQETPSTTPSTPDVVIPPRHTFVSTDKPTTFFVEGTSESSKARDNSYQLGIEGLEGDGDRVSITVVDCEILSNKTRVEVRTVAIVPEKPARPSGQTAFFTAPVIVGRNFPIELRTFMPRAGPLAFLWTAQGGAALSLADTDKQILKLTATGLSTKLDDTLVQVLLTTDRGQFLRRHRMTVVTVTLDSVASGEIFAAPAPPATPDINLVRNPAGIVILTGADAADAKKVAKLEMIKFATPAVPPSPGKPGTPAVPASLGIEPNLTWTDDDDRLAWWIIGEDGGEYPGKADFRNVESAKRGTKVEVFGIKEGDILVQPYSGGFGYGMFRANVVPLKKIKFRANRILTNPVPPVPPSPGKPGKPAIPAHGPTRSAADAQRHIDMANVYLRQMGIELIPDNSADAASKAGTPTIGLAALDPRVVSVTRTSAGHFDVVVDRIGMTFRAQDFGNVAAEGAIRVNARNEIITIAYIESLASGTTALAQAQLIPTNHTKGGVLKDKGTPSSSLIKKTGIPGDTPVGQVSASVLVSFRVGAQPATPANGARSVNLLWGIAVPTSSVDAFVARPDIVAIGSNSDQIYGSTLAHEVGHMLGLRHRIAAGDPFADGLTTPRTKNLMFPRLNVSVAENLDIAQNKIIRFSEVLARNP